MPCKDPEKNREKARKWRLENLERARAAQRARYYANREEHLRKGKEYRAKHPARNRVRDPEKVREIKRRYREKHREKLREANQRERLEHPERVKARQQRYIEKNREQYLLLSRKHCHTRYARKKSAEGSFTEDDIKLLQERQRGKCYWCKKAYRDSFHIDHIWPLSRGGSNGPENLCIACKACNLKKNNKTPMEWAGKLL